MKKRDKKPKTFSSNSYLSDEEVIFNKEQEKTEQILNSSTFLNISQVSKRLGYDRSSVHYLINKGKFFNSFQDKKNQWWVPISEVEKYENKKAEIDIILESSTFLGSTDTAKKLNISKNQIYSHIAENSFPNALQDIYTKWWIPLSDIEIFELQANEKMEVKNNSFTISQLCKRTGKTYQSVEYQIKKNKFPNAFRDEKKRWLIPLSDVTNYEKKQEITSSNKVFSITKLASIWAFSTAKILYLIKTSHLPNAFQDEKKQWWIPITDISIYEKKNVITLLTSNSDDFLSIAQIKNKYGISRKRVLGLIQSNSLSNAFQDEKKRWWIPTSNNEILEKVLSDTILTNDTLNYISINQAAKILNTYREKVLVLIKNNSIPNAFQDINNTWRIPLSDLEIIKNKIVGQEKFINSSYLSLIQVANKTGFTRRHVSTLAKNNKFPSAIQTDSNKWWIPLADVEKLEIEIFNSDETFNSDAFFSLNEAANRLGCTVHLLNELIQTKIFPNATKNSKKVWFVPISDIEKYEENQHFINTGFLSTRIASNQLGLKTENMLNLIRANKFPNIIKDKMNKWQIPTSDIEEYKKELVKKEQLKNSKSLYTVARAAKHLELSSKTILNLIKKNDLPNAYQNGLHKWWIPISDLENFEIAKKNSKDYLSLSETSKRLGISNSNNIIKLISRRCFPHAFSDDRKRWKIPILDIETFEKKRMDYPTSFHKYLSIIEIEKRLGTIYEKSGFTILKEFPNAYQDVYKEWWISPSDFQSYQKIQRKKVPPNFDIFYDIPAVFKYLIRKKEFPNAFQDDDKNWWIPPSDIESFQQKKSGVYPTDFHTFLSTNEVKERLKSNQNIVYLIRSKKFPSSFQDEYKKWWISRSDIESYKKITTLKYPPDFETFHSVNEIQEKLVSKTKVNILIRRNEFPNAFKDEFKKWWIPDSDIESFNKKSTSTYPVDFHTYLSASKVKERLGITTNKLNNFIRKKEFPKAFKDASKMWWIPFSDIESFEKKRNYPEDFENFLSAVSIKVKLGITTYKFQNLIQQKEFPNAFQDEYNKWWIPISDIENFETEMNEKEKIMELDSNFSLNEIAIQLDCKKTVISRLLKEKKFPTAFKINKQWCVPYSDFEQFQKSLNSITSDLTTNYSTSEVAERLNVKRIYVTRLIQKKKFPLAFQDTLMRWWIPITDIEIYEKEKEIEKIHKKKETEKIHKKIEVKKIDYTPILAFDELKVNVNSYLKISLLPETKTLFLNYCLTKINSFSGSNSYKKGRVQFFYRFFFKLMSIIEVEIFELSSDEVNQLMIESSPMKKKEKGLLTQFLTYANNAKGISNDFKFVVSHKNRKNDTKEIYTPETFHEIYMYAKNISVHLRNALKSRHYANMWVYTILLCTDFIRGSDLIVNTPNIDLDDIETSIESLINLDLSDSQVQRIINQLYLHFRHKRSSKTDELLTFIVAPDLAKPLSTALVISEVFRRESPSSLQLDTFITGELDKTITQGSNSHLKFFKSHTNLKNLHFSSLKMNNSVATYLFYSITEGDDYDSELALYLTQVSRSHLDANTTSKYIQMTNKDGSINRVSHNLFRRGNFGWLYNQLVLFISQGKTISNTMEERTMLIEDIKSDLSPKMIENYSEFITNYTSVVSEKDYDPNENYIKSIYEARQTIIDRLKKYNIEELHEILLSISKNEMPSKNEHAQCFIYPNCKYPKLKNCFSCEYVIPQNLILIQLKEELFRLLSNLEATTNKILIQRDTKHLLHNLLLWKEARETFGNEHVTAFISPSEIKRRLNQVAHKITLD